MSIARGDARMRELGAARKARADVVAAELISTLSRPATPVDRVMAALVAAAMVKLESQLELGSDTTSARRGLAEALAGSPFAPVVARDHATA